MSKAEESAVSHSDMTGMLPGLREFLADCVWHRHACVRVITGKGNRSGHRGPVIKPRVARWLRKHDRVDAFSTARPNDGGSGALYVLLAVD